MDYGCGIPCIDFSKDPKDLVEGSEGWKKLCIQVREACANYGGLKELFDLPDETKMKNSGSVHHGYLGKFEGQPLYESLGIHNSPIFEQSQAFTDLMWPDGNLAFCTKAPFTDDWTLGLSPHTDQDLITILYEDRQGLEILSKEGQWLQVVQQPKTFVVMVGKTLMAWSNGRMHAPKHRVMVKGEKDRYSYGLFACLKEGVIVETPKELVDKDHPLLFRPFNYRDYIQYLRANFYLDSALETFAGTGGAV
ncbi:hypothetical protein MKW92_021999 [Papaver armeniacum]|nr:hypothetical protein MKW92_021999 [Papaver armeniacum]